MLLATQLLEAIDREIAIDGGYRYRRFLQDELAQFANKPAKDGQMRKHLGPSTLGHECDREIWYSFRRAKATGTPDARVLRLFSRGDLEEPRIHAALKLVGAIRDDATAKRFEKLAGHYGGEIDALYSNVPGEPLNTPHVVEIKTYNRERFGALVLHGVKESDEHYYYQMQAYAREHNVLWSLFIATNKDNDDIHAEWVESSVTTGRLLEDRAIYIINVDTPPARIKNDKTWYVCKLCSKRGICHKNEQIDDNCRTCAHATPDTEKGGWTCAIDRDEIQHENGCDQHVYLPSLIPDTWQYVGGDGRNAHYTNDAGDTIINGPDGKSGADFWSGL